VVSSGAPASGQQPGGEQAGKDLGVKPIGLVLCLSDRLKVPAGRDHDPRRARLEDARDRKRVARRPERDLVVG
jgi:hypothetical protein